MKFVDDSQNLRMRLRLIQALVLVLLGVLCVRLYLLQIIEGKRYAEVAENQRIRLLPIPAPRGAILDRNGNQQEGHHERDAPSPLVEDLIAEIGARRGTPPKPFLAPDVTEGRS